MTGNETVVPVAGEQQIAIRRYRASDRDAVIRLWDRCGLLRSWNPPDADIDLSVRGPQSVIFVGVIFVGAISADPRRADAPGTSPVVASVMAGSDGHRGWLYYLAVDPEHRGRGIARGLVRHAEEWLGAHGIRKVQLMIREDNEAARGFYERVGYASEPRTVMSRWLPAPEDG